MGLVVNLSMVFDQPTGIATYALNVLPGLAGLEPTLLSATSYADFNSREIPGNMTPAQGSRGHFRRLTWTQWQLPKLFKQLQGSLLFSPVPEAPLGINLPTVVTVLDLIPLRFGGLSALKVYFWGYVPRVLAQARHIVCISQSTADDLVSFYGINANRITPIPLACTSVYYQSQSTTSATTPPYFLYVGRQDPYKNLSLLLTAFANSAHDAELWLAGPEDPRFTPQLRSQARELNIAHRVKFLGYVPSADLPGLYANAITLVFPSRWEGFGIPVLEAMASGIPVIAAKAGAVPEVMGDAGILLDPDDLKGFAQQMEQIYRDDSFRQALCDRSRARASQYSWQRTGQATAQVLERFL